MFLSTCVYGEWYARLTGDEVTARQFEQVRKKMLAGLNSPAPMGQQAAPVDASGYQQLSLL